MAIAHAQFKTGKAGTAGGSHARYISGIDDFSSRSDVRGFVDGNLPSWAKSATEFFDAADTWERANGRAYSEIEFAIPRELKTPEEQNRFAMVFAAKMVGETHPFRLAIHDKKAADGGRNVHAHLMFSERLLDGIERNPEQFFSRANKKNPERGGCAKDRRWNDRGVVEHVRRMYQEQCREHGIHIDMRSFERRGIDAVPEPKIGRGFFKDEKAAELVAAIREYKGAMRQVKAIRKEISEVEKKIENRAAAIQRRREKYSEPVNSPVRLAGGEWVPAEVLAAYQDKMIRDRQKKEVQPVPQAVQPEPEKVVADFYAEWLNDLESKLGKSPYGSNSSDHEGTVLAVFDHPQKRVVAVRLGGSYMLHEIQNQTPEVGEMIEIRYRNGQGNAHKPEPRQQKSRGPRMG